MIAVDSVWDRYIDQRWLAELEKTPFLSRAAAGRATRGEMRRFASQHFHYSRHFTRYLCALIGNLTDEADRFALTENLFEEMGLGDLGEIPHAQLYREMLTELGIDPALDPASSETMALVEAMSDACANRDPLVGLGALCLGAEAIVPFVYSRIVKGFEGIGIPEETLRFFHIHIEGDDDHAKTMKAIIDRALAKDPTRIDVLRASAGNVIAKRVAMLASIEAPDRSHLRTVAGGFVSGLQF